MQWGLSSPKRRNKDMIVCFSLKFEHLNLLDLYFPSRRNRLFFADDGFGKYAVSSEWWCLGGTVRVRAFDDDNDRDVVRLCRSKVPSRFRSNDAANEGVLYHFVRSLSYNQTR